MIAVMIERAEHCLRMAADKAFCARMVRKPAEDRMLKEHKLCNASIDDAKWVQSTSQTGWRLGNLRASITALDSGKVSSTYSYDATYPAQAARSLESDSPHDV